jgi:mannose-6-phosphate isomerase
VTASRLASRQVEKLWGRAQLPRSFGAAAAGSEPIGEIWFQDGRGPEAELLVKYLLTREKLSIQVHPDGPAARAVGHRRGKDEAWLVLEAEPGARIGLGLKHRVSPAQLRCAIEAGTLEALVDWREAKAGDFYYSPAGTIHALGPGLTLVEIQENVDLTYRLFDYGRERELQVEAGVKAARPEPFWRADAAPGDRAGPRDTGGRRGLRGRTLDPRRGRPAGRGGRTAGMARPGERQRADRRSDRSNRPPSGWSRIRAGSGSRPDRRCCSPIPERR